MKILFFWNEIDGDISPECSSETVNMDGVSILTCLLMDDGGNGYQESIPWIEEGIKAIDSVTNGENKNYSWDRESWGALLSENEVKVYSLLDDDYCELISHAQFRGALVSWASFLLSSPRLGECKEVEL